MPRDNDYLIVGAGISGALLSRALAKRGKSVLLVHSLQQSGSSPVASWMINPITGLRFTPSWRIETLLPYAKSTYAELEKESGLTLYHEQRILRYLKSDEEWARWEKKGSDPFIAGHTSLLATEKGSDPFFLDTHGCVEIRGGGWVNLNAWLPAYHKNPPAGVSVLSEHLQSADFTVEKDHVSWKNHGFRKAIFCSGYSHWPWFDWLPWKAAKGEILTVRIPGLGLRDIIKKGLFIIPMGDDIYRVGATYEWASLNEEPTEKGKLQLLDALQKLIPLPLEVLSQGAAVRPSFQGTIPAVGLNPRYPALGLFNGLGSKGGLSAPWLADHLADHLEGGVPLDAEVDLARNN